MAAQDLKDPQAQAALKTSLAMAYLALGDSRKASDAIAAALAASPRDVRAQTVQAQLAALANDLPRALSLVNGALAQAPDNAEALIMKAQFLGSQGQQDEALKTLQHAVDANPAAINARFALVSRLVALGQLDPAAAQVAAMKKLSPQEFRTLYAEALVSFARGDAAHAREVIQQVLAVLPDNLPSLYLSGLIDMTLGFNASAEEALRKVVARQPGVGRPALALAVVYLRTGRSSQAIETLEAALKRTPDDAALLRAAGEASLASGNAGQAARYYGRANAVDNSNQASQVRLAQVRLAAGDTGQALQDLEALSAADPSRYQADLALITAHLQRGEFGPALAAVAELEKKQPKNPLTYNIKGVTYAGMRDLKKARASFEKALEVQPGYLPAVQNLALLDVQEQKPEDARKRYEELLTKDPKNEQLLLALAQVLVLTGHKPEEVKAVLERAVAAAPQSVRPRLALISYETSRYDFSAALAAAQAAQAAFPDNAQVLETLGAAQRAAGQTSQAIETFKRLVQLQPQNDMALLRLADAQVVAKDFDSAIATLHTAINVAPDQTQTWVALAKAYVISGHPESAIAEARKLQREHSDRALGFALEGEVLVAEKKWPEAANAFGEALARQAIPMLQAKRYQALQNAGMTVQANASMAQWMQKHPKDITLYAFLAEQSQASKDYPGAIVQYKAALKVDPDNTLLLNNIGSLLAESGDPAAVQYAERAYRQAPFNPNVMDTYGWALVQSGQVPKGLELLRAATGLAPTDLQIRLHLGKALLKAGDKSGARQVLDPLTRLDQASPIRGEAEQLLRGP
jgi:putative PEP-CTERM system TPR-repeat lipoprotein